MRNQRRLVLTLALALVALLLFLRFGPEPTNTHATELSEEEIAELMAPWPDTGGTVETIITDLYLIIPADDDPCGELLVIDVMSGDSCSIPPEAKTYEIQYH